MKIHAFAGAGKTTTLQLLASCFRGKGLYLAFNRAIAEEASKKFPTEIQCRTTHSLALRHMRQRAAFKNEKLFGDMRAKELVDHMGLTDTVFGKAMKVSATQKAAMVRNTVKAFCMSGDDNLQRDHLQIGNRVLRANSRVRGEVMDEVLREVSLLWERMTDHADPTPLGHDGYLKLWSLDRPQIGADLILLDEAQDTNPAVLSVLQAQRNTKMVYVGDRHQQIYEWRGAVNAMDLIETDEEVHLTRSFRFGPAIADLATRVLRCLGEERAVIGNPSIDSQVLTAGDAEAHLCRTNTEVFKQALEGLEQGRPYHIVGNLSELELLVGDVFSLQKGQPGSHPQHFGFSSWREVQEFAKSEEGEDLLPFVNLVEQHGPGALWKALKLREDHPGPDVLTVSTTHRGKGCEWGSVRVENDFSGSISKDSPIADEERRLFYVAVTRAREKLVVHPTLVRAFTTVQPLEGGASGPYTLDEVVVRPQPRPTNTTGQETQVIPYRAPLASNRKSSPRSSLSAYSMGGTESRVAEPAAPSTSELQNHGNKPAESSGTAPGTPEPEDKPSTGFLRRMLFRK